MNIYVRWFFVVLFFSSLTSFIGEHQPAKGLDVGEIAPDFNIKTVNDGGLVKKLSSMRGQYVVLSFWTTDDAQSRMRNVALNGAFEHCVNRNVAFISVSFDEYLSVFQESIRMDGISTPFRFAETEGERSDLYDKYNLGKGLTNFLLDDHGMIIAKNISASELSSYLK